MASDVKIRTYRLPRRRERSVGLFGSDLPQTILSLAAATISVFILRSGGMGNLLMVLVVLAVCGTITFLPIVGRPMYDWVPALLTYLLQMAGGQPKPEKSSGLEGATAPKIVLADIRITPVDYVDGSGDKPVNRVAAICNDGAGTYWIAFRVEADSFLLRDGGAQDRTGGMWGRLLDECAGPGSKVTGVTVHTSILPASTAEHESHYPNMSDDYRALMREVGEKTCSHLTTVIIQTTAARMRQGLGKKHRGDVGKRAIANALIAAFNTFETHLKGMGARNMRLYSPAEYPLLTRMFWDPFAHDTIFRQLMAGTLQTVAMWPETIEQTRSSVTVNGTKHVMYSAEHYPSADLYADWLSYLINVGRPIRQVTWVARPTTNARASRRSEMRATLSDAVALERGQAGRRQTAVDELAESERTQRRKQLAAGRTEWRTSMFVRVSGRTDEELLANDSLAQAQAMRCGIELRPLLFEQLRFMKSSLPVAQSLR